jgi:hypothetical protein
LYTALLLKLLLEKKAKREYTDRQKYETEEKYKEKEFSGG